MPNEIEISCLDTRFENHRLKNSKIEDKLLCSILQRGICDPLQGIDVKDNLILLDGFKRYRCAKKLNISIVPYDSLSNNEAVGIMELIRTSNSKKLDTLEEALLIDELINVYNMSTADIASYVDRSKSWVSVRTGIVDDMSEIVKDKVFNGKFPVYSFMYTLRPFIRINGKNMKEIDEFVNLLAGKNISIREIDQLAQVYFNKNKQDLKEQIKKGNIVWLLDRLKNKKKQKIETCTEIEREMLKTLEILQRYIQKCILKCQDERFSSNEFFAQANILIEGIVKQMDIFSKAIKDFYDRTRQT